MIMHFSLFPAPFPHSPLRFLKPPPNNVPAPCPGWFRADSEEMHTGSGAEPLLEAEACVRFCLHGPSEGLGWGRRTRWDGKMAARDLGSHRKL